MATVVLFFSVGLCLLFTCSSQGELLVFPEGEEHSILCTAPDEDHFEINWGTTAGGFFENEGTFTVGEEEPDTNGTKGRRVLFTASPEVNGTTLRCFVINFRQPSDSLEPLEFTIIIQGNLSAPDVDYHVGDGSILFSWSPPFSHNITNVEPDISHYLVYVYGNDLPEYTVITTKTRYILQNGNCGIKKYQVTIAAVNLVGVGEKYASPHFSIEVLRSVSNFKTDLSGDFPVLKLQLHANCLDDVIYHVELVPTYSSGPSLNLSNTTQFGQTLLTLSSEEVTFNEYYKATVRIQGFPRFQYHLTLSTFDVQSVALKEYSGYVHITCHFAVGSKLKECKIVLRSHEAMNQGIDSRYVYTARRIAGSLEAAAVIVLPNGNYTVDVFDNDNETEYPAYSTELTISYAQLKEKTDTNETMEEMSDCQFNCSLSVGIAVGLTLLAMVIILSITLVLLFLSKRLRKQNNDESAEKQHKYIMDDNPVYTIHTKGSHINNTSKTHEYDTVASVTSP